MLGKNPYSFPVVVSVIVVISLVLAMVVPDFIQINPYDYNEKLPEELEIKIYECFDSAVPDSNTMSIHNNITEKLPILEDRLEDVENDPNSTYQELVNAMHELNYARFDRISLVTAVIKDSPLCENETIRQALEHEEKLFHNHSVLGFELDD